MKCEYYWKYDEDFQSKPIGLNIIHFFIVTSFCFIELQFNLMTFFAYLFFEYSNKSLEFQFTKKTLLCFDTAIKLCLKTC